MALLLLVAKGAAASIRAPVAEDVETDTKSLLEELAMKLL
jgi:hypothetical protein